MLVMPQLLVIVDGLYIAITEVLIKGNSLLLFVDKKFSIISSQEIPLIETLNALFDSYIRSP